MPHLRPLRESDVADVLALNERNVVMLAPMDERRLHDLREIADRFDVLDVDGCFAGFVVTFASDTPYDSENYAWFSERFDTFCYLDRVAVHEDFRRRGLGTFLYDEVEDGAKRHGRLLLEVNLVPRNDPSLAFHEARGYVEVGQRGDPDHRVSMKEKRL